MPEWEQKKLWKHTEELRLTLTDKHYRDVEEVVTRPTYTRMSLQYLSLETLYYYKIDFERDSVSLTPEHLLPPALRI